MNRIKNSQVGTAPHSTKWHRAQGAYSAKHAGRTLTVVWVYRKQWAVAVDGKYLPHTFEGPRAAQRYALGASLTCPIVESLERRGIKGR